MKRIPEAWSKNYGRGARVVVLDSVYTQCQHVYPAAIKRFVSSGPASAHATKVAQVVASHNTENLGIAPLCELYVGEVVGTLPKGWGSLCDALAWARDLKAAVVNMSFACSESQQGADAILKELDASGCICVASYNALLHWPHSLPQVVSVGIEGQNAQCNVRARSEAIVRIGGNWETFRGTSAAAALVTGLAACAKAADRRITREMFLKHF